VNVKSFRSALSIVEILLGLILIAVAVYGAWINRHCSLDGYDCGALGAIVVFYFFVIGLMTLAVGGASYYWRKPPLLAFQVPFSVVIVVFHLWLMNG
jgi:hypothetical protein